MHPHVQASLHTNPPRSCTSLARISNPAHPAFHQRGSASLHLTSACAEQARIYALSRSDQTPESRDRATGIEVYNAGTGRWKDSLVRRRVMSISRDVGVVRILEIMEGE